MEPLFGNQLENIGKYIKKNSARFPKLVPALRALEEFVGHDDIKETVVKMVLFYISQCAALKPLRRSKRRRASSRAGAPREGTRGAPSRRRPRGHPAQTAMTDTSTTLTGSSAAGAPCWRLAYRRWLRPSPRGRRRRRRRIRGRARTSSPR